MSNKTKEILSGFTSLIKSKVGLTTEQEETMSKLRRDICNGCIHGKGRDTCNACGCWIAAKVRCAECECPEGNW